MEAADWSKLSICVRNLDCDDLLSDWRWLVDQSFTPFDMTAFGDWFLEGVDGGVFMLDLVSGKLNKISASKQQFLCDRNEPKNLDKWFMADNVHEAKMYQHVVL